MAKTKPVIIAGAGPTGLVLGLELARYGEFIMPGGFLPPGSFLSRRVLY